MNETLEGLRGSVSEEPLDQLKKAIAIYDSELAKSAAKKAVEQKLDPLEALDAMTVAIRLVGDAYSAGELWLPDLVGASDAMSAASPILEEEIKRRGAKRKTLGTVVMGAVFGDIHSIGKTMVATLLTAEGFSVHDLGVNQKPEEFIEAIEKYNPDIVGMSALMTITLGEQRHVIDVLKEKGIRDRIKIMVGGGPVDSSFAEAIGADGYSPTAPGAVKEARSLMGLE
jgi:corrinoid protein of di/trimethylamine methyltransferase